MFTVLTRTSNRPRYFTVCRESVFRQTVKPYWIVSTDDDNDTYLYDDPRPDQVIRVQREQGRGSNLYFNTMRLYVPGLAPWVIHLDDDDQFTHDRALEVIQQHIPHENALILWRVQIPERIIPPIGEPPTFGHITGIGFAVHVKHWHNWQAVSGGDFKVIDHYYRTLQPVWIDQVLTQFQSAPGGGLRQDLKT